MKKKIKDLTGEEWKTICHKHEKCSTCPLRTPRPVNKETQRKYLEIEVEIDE